MGIGDPTVWGWSITALYAAATVSCAALAWRTHSGNSAEHGALQRRAFWLLLTTMLLALGVNKQLDLQTLLWLKARVAIRSIGLYEVRIWIQFALIAAVAALGAVVYVVLFKLVRGAKLGPKLALTGLVFLLSFICVRIISIGPIDHLLNHSVLLWKMNHLLEGGGLCILLAGTALSHFQSALPVSRPAAPVEDAAPE
ncbi:MAG: hypothetical protein FJY92_05435 [Candidatus Hydrogenedentes bacterium]|nr:hypothetical protein [Candidatus Hydrogenedentota bacterium]